MKVNYPAQVGKLLRLWGGIRQTSPKQNKNVLYPPVYTIKLDTLITQCPAVTGSSPGNRIFRIHISLTLIEKLMVLPSKNENKVYFSALLAQRANR